jgi:hypothetical protein
MTISRFDGPIRHRRDKAAVDIFKIGLIAERQLLENLGVGGRRRWSRRIGKRVGATLN